MILDEIKISVGPSVNFLSQTFLKQKHIYIPVVVTKLCYLWKNNFENEMCVCITENL